MIGDMVYFCKILVKASMFGNLVSTYCSALCFHNFCILIHNTCILILKFETVKDVMPFKFTQMSLMKWKVKFWQVIYNEGYVIDNGTW